MTLELLKIMVQPVVLERNGDGKIIGEKTGEAIAIFELDQLNEYMARLQQEIAATNGQTDGSQGR